MPLYEYECKQCKKHTEKIQKFSDPEITVCPFCGGELERVISAPAVQFKGGGWFSDGYASKKPASGGESSGTSSSDAPSTSTPAAAPTVAPSAPAAPSTSSSSSDK